MTREAERKRLVELCENVVLSCKSSLCADCEHNKIDYPHCMSEHFADHLLKNGIVVPPVKVGEIVYWLTPYGIEELTVDLIKIIGNQDIRIRTRRFVKEVVYFSLKHFGKTVFTSRAEAEKALKERETK